MKERAVRNRRLAAMQLAETPDDFMIHLHMARLEEDDATAECWARRAYELWVERGAWEPRMNALMLVTLLMRLVKQTKWDEALELWERHDGWRSSEACMWIAYAMVAKGQYEEAIAELNRAVVDETLLHEIGGDEAAWSWKPMKVLSEVYALIAQNMKQNDALNLTMCGARDKTLVVG